MAPEIEFPPFRNVEDFAMDATRYKPPPVDLERWANRLENNLVYYQSNYFGIVLVFFLLVGFIYPKEMLVGVATLSTVLAVFAFASASQPKAVELKKAYPLAAVALVALVTYLLVMLIGSVPVFLSGVSFPILSVVFEKAYPLAAVALVALVTYLLVMLIGSVPVFLSGVSFPILLVFVHASMRLRSLKNKIENKLEAVGFKKTPMGHLLRVFGIEVELINFAKFD